MFKQSDELHSWAVSLVYSTVFVIGQKCYYFESFISEFVNSFL